VTDIEFVKSDIEKKKDEFISANDSIYGFAELSYEEFKSADLLCGILEREGFSVKRGLAGIPTCFSGTYGSGRPVMGILGEFDALPGLSQEAGVPEHRPVKKDGPGHGCGHCCLGTGSLAAAVAVKDYLKSNSLDGTVIYFGCPAEEGAGSKQFMARAGLFNSCDFCYTWHPSSLNDVSADSSTAIMGANFRFKGIAAHAGGSPWLGRSALDAVELMSVGCNYLREHIPDGQRIHYAYSDAGGTFPNVVPDHATVKYEVRASTVKDVKALFERVVKVAKGAAMMTETTLTYEITMAFSDFSNNSVLASIASGCLEELGAPDWDDSDYALASAFLKSYGEMQLEGIKKAISDEFGSDKTDELLSRPLHTGVVPYDQSSGKAVGGSSDVGDVGYAAPTAELHVATCCLGNIGHTWQMAGQAGSSIGHKGLLRAGEAIALSCIRTMARPDLIKKAREEYINKSGGKYVCPLPDSVKPPIGRY
jgi:aminobenzoyl-glutamate utilization protein B